MPGGDRTGPLGAGQMTGRGAGLCAGFGRPGYMNPAGRGYGYGVGFAGRFGGGRGRGWRRQFWATGVPGWARYGWNDMMPEYMGGESDMPTRKVELDSLKEQAKYYGKALENIKRRIDQLQKENKSEKEN